MFKRNQVEEAIALVYEPELAKPSSEIPTQLKRLLETDRSLGRNKRSSDPEKANFAFYSMDTLGRGTENSFSEYEVFALLTCFRLMRHGWPQTRAVALLRGVRPRLEKHHARILKQDATALFDQDLIKQRAQPGTIAVDNTDPVFLVITSGEQQGRSSANSTAICRGQEELMPFIKAQGSGKPWTALELVNSIHGLSSTLAKIRPRRRGRVAEK
jgi:hypothetical protein